MPDAYSILARAYDALMDDFDYAAWCAYYEKIGAFARGMRVCECACGTGSFSIPLSRGGYNLVCSDISENMLRVAQERARKAGRQIRFVLGDMRRLVVPRPVERILCACDGVNYLTDGLSDFFRSAHAALVPGGKLCFDISSESKLSAQAGQVFFDERDDLSCFWACEREGDILSTQLTLFEKTSSGLYERREESHAQRIYSQNEIEIALREAGFGNIAVYGDMTFDAPEKDSKRLHFVAERA